MTLQELTDKKIERVYINAYNRMWQALGLGYQPFGLDNATLAVISPSWYRTIRALSAEFNRRTVECF